MLIWKEMFFMWKNMVVIGFKCFLFTWLRSLYEQDGPIMKEAPSRIISRNTNAVNEKKEFKPDKSRTERWKATNIVALADCNLKV